MCNNDYVVFYIEEKIMFLDMVMYCISEGLILNVYRGLLFKLEE